MTTARSPSGRRFVDALDTVVANSAGPYGYTISIWSSGAILMHARGAPDVLEVFLFALGALTGFVVLGLSAIAISSTVTTLDRGGERVMAGMLNWLAIGAGVGSVALLAQIHSRLVWMFGSLAATAVYLLGASAQLALVDSRARRRNPE
jgi:hypothetical protein